jgi:hypothetical protein
MLSLPLPLIEQLGLKRAPHPQNLLGDWRCRDGSLRRRAAYDPRAGLRC